jgi:hypothetical protein
VTRSNAFRFALGGEFVIIAAILALPACRLSGPTPDTSVLFDHEDLSVALDRELYGHMAPAGVWGSPYVPRISAAILVSEERATLKQVSRNVSHHLLEPLNKEPASLTVDEIRYVMGAVDSTTHNPDGFPFPITPAVIIPSGSASMHVMRGLLDFGPDAVLVAWDNGGRRPAVADIWRSISTEPNAYNAGPEFHFRALAAHDILIVGPTKAIECEAPQQGLGPCRVVEGRSPLTRVGLCGFEKWGQALEALESRMSRVTDVALLKDCGFLDQQVGGRGPTGDPG